MFGMGGVEEICCKGALRDEGKGGFLQYLYWPMDFIQPIDGSKNF